MPQIPVYEQKVGIDAGGTTAPQLSGPMPSASGANVAEAVGGLGKTVAHGAEEMAGLVAYKMRLDSQQKVDDLSEKASADWQNHLNGDGGLLTRQADAAKGITSGTQDNDFMGPTQGARVEGGVKYKDSFDGFSADLKRRYLEQASTDYEKRLLNHALDAHERVLRNAVIQHEGQQAKIARGNAADAAVNAYKDTAVNAVDAFDFESAMGDGINRREKALRAEGHTDESVIDAVRMKTADEFAEAGVHANLERDPEKAQSILDAAKDKLSGSVKASLQDHIDGKMIAARSDAINHQVFSENGSKNDDMTFNLGFIEKRASEMASGRPPAEQIKLVRMAKEQATMADSALHQQKEQATRSYLDGFAELRDKGLSFPEAEKTIMAHVAKQYGQVFGAAETDDLRAKAVNIYKRDPAAIEARLTVMRPDQKQAYADAVNVIRSKYKTQTAVLPGETEEMKLADAMINQLKPLAPKMTAAQISEWTKKGLENVVVKPGWISILDDKKPAWQVARSKQ